MVSSSLETYVQVIPVLSTFDAINTIVDIKIELMKDDKVIYDYTTENQRAIRIDGPSINTVIQQFYHSDSISKIKDVSPSAIIPIVWL